MVLIEDILNIPKEASVNDIISKDLLFKEAGLNKSDKDKFVKFVKQIRWLYNIDDSTMRIKPYKDDEREYLEMQIINITLKDEFEVYNRNTGNFHRYDARLDRIADIILRNMPYPILLSFEFKDEIKFYVSHIKNSLADYDKITLDKLINTEWIKTSNLSQLDKDFIDKLQLENLDYTNIYTFYDSFITAIIQYKGSKEVGETVELDSNEIQNIMDEIKLIDRQIADLRVKIRKEPNFRDQMDLQMEIRNLKMDKKILQNNLTGE